MNVYCDSQSAIHLTKHATFHERTKHIDIRLHFVRDIVARQLVNVEKIATEVNPATLFTKVIPVGKFKEALSLLSIME